MHKKDCNTIAPEGSGLDQTSKNTSLRRTGFPIFQRTIETKVDTESQLSYDDLVSFIKAQLGVEDGECEEVITMQLYRPAEYDSKGGMTPDRVVPFTKSSCLQVRISQTSKH